jgi:hypothetical protein
MHVFLLQIVEGGCESDVYVHNSFDDEMFAKHGLIGQASRVFHSTSIHNMMWLHGMPQLWDVWAMVEGIGTI